MAPRTRGMNPKMKLADMLTRATGKVGAIPDPIRPGLPPGRGEGPWQWGLPDTWGRGTGNPYGWPQGPFAQPPVGAPGPGLPAVIERPLIGRSVLDGATLDDFLRGQMTPTQRMAFEAEMARARGGAGGGVFGNGAATDPRWQDVVNRAKAGPAGAPEIVVPDAVAGPGSQRFEAITPEIRALTEGGVTREEAALTRMLGNRSLASSGVPIEAGPVGSTGVRGLEAGFPRLALNAGPEPVLTARPMGPIPTTLAESLAADAPAAARGVRSAAPTLSDMAGAGAGGETAAGGGILQRLRGLLPGGGGGAADEAAGFLSSLKPASLLRGGAGLGAGLVTGMAVDPILGMAIGGEAEDPGFSVGGLGKALLSGGAAGGVGAGVASGGAAALPGAAIGAVLGGLGYLYSEATQKDVPSVDDNVKTMQSMATEYGTDPALTNKVVGSYRLLADLYKKNGMEDQIPDLTKETFTSLAGVLGTPAPKPLLNTSDLGTLSKMMYEQTSPWLNQMSPDSPYRVALMQQLANFPTSLVLAGATTPQDQSGVATSGLQGLAMDQTKASGKGASLAAGLSDADTAKLIAQGIRM